MSLAASRLSLTHLATIQRDTAAGAGSDGWTDSPDWEDHLTDLPCRAWAGVGTNDERTESTTLIVQEGRRMIVQVGTDVTETDRVVAVTHRGHPFLDGPMNIEAVIRYPDHLELVLQRVK